MQNKGTVKIFGSECSYHIIYFPNQNKIESKGNSINNSSIIIVVDCLRQPLEKQLKASSGKFKGCH